MEYIQSLGEQWQDLVDNQIKTSNEKYIRSLAKGNANDKEEQIQTLISTNLDNDEEEHRFEDNNKDYDAKLSNSQKILNTIDKAWNNFDFSKLMLKDEITY